MSTIAQLPAIIFGVLAFALLPVTTAQSAGKTEIVISGTPDHGVFDPSVARSDSRRLYMSLSGVSSTAAGGSLGALAVQTLLAFSDDQGLSWQLVKQAVTPEIEVSLDSFAAPHRGRWQSEVTLDGSCSGTNISMQTDRGVLSMAGWPTRRRSGRRTSHQRAPSNSSPLSAMTTPIIRLSVQQNLRFRAAPWRNFSSYIKTCRGVRR